MVGLSVVSQTLCKIVVFPAFALPMTSTRNLIFGIGRDCFVSIAFVSIGERQSQESIIDLKRLGSHARLSAYFITLFVTNSSLK